MCISSSWRYSYNKYSTNQNQFRKQYRFRQFKKNDEEFEEGISQNEYKWSNILRHYKVTSSNLDHLILYKFVAFHYCKDQIIHPQFFGYNNVVNFPPT